MSENENNAVFPMSLADVDKATLSPMMQQYAEMKESLGDTFLFYRLGDFY